MKKHSRTQALLAALTLSLSSSVFAHAVWLERNAQNTHLYFGEYDEARREASPGRLDDIGTPRLLINGTAIDGRKESQGWQCTTPGKATDIRAEVLEMAIKDWRKQGIGIVKPQFFARFAESPAAIKPTAQLDLVPLGSVGDFGLFLNGLPLANTKVAVVAPNGWMREVRSDNIGRLKVDMPWKGLYVLEATHVVAEPGSEKGQAFEGLRLRTTLSYRQQQGKVTFSPAPPAANAY